MRRREPAGRPLTDEEKSELLLAAEERWFSALPNDERVRAVAEALAEHGVSSLECIQAGLRVRRAERARGPWPLLPAEPVIRDGRLQTRDGWLLDL